MGLGPGCRMSHPSRGTLWSWCGAAHSSPLGPAGSSTLSPQAWGCECWELRVFPHKSFRDLRDRPQSHGLRQTLLWGRLAWRLPFICFSNLQCPHYEVRPLHRVSLCLPLTWCDPGSGQPPESLTRNRWLPALRAGPAQSRCNIALGSLQVPRGHQTQALSCSLYRGAEARTWGSNGPTKPLSS